MLSLQKRTVKRYLVTRLQKSYIKGYKVLLVKVLIYIDIL